MLGEGNDQSDATFESMNGVEKEKKVNVNFFEKARENLYAQIEAAATTQYPKEILPDVFQPELDLLTLPAEWQDLDPAQKAEVMNNKIGSYERQRYDKDLQINDQGEINQILTKIDPGFGSHLQGIAQALLSLQTQAETGNDVHSCNIQNYSGKDGNHWRRKNIDLANPRGKLFQSVVGVDLENGQETEKYADDNGKWVSHVVTYPTSTPGVIYSESLRHEGDTAHETFLANLSYTQPKEEASKSPAEV